jgi:hypothetical protein
MKEVILCILPQLHKPFKTLLMEMDGHFQIVKNKSWTKIYARQTTELRKLIKKMACIKQEDILNVFL